MKRIPAGLLVATLFLAAPLPGCLFAEESAQQLADQTLGADSNAQDQSAQQLANQQLGKNSDQQAPSAEDVAKQNGVAIKPGSDPEQSAADIAKQQGLIIPPEQNESARKLAEKEGLENKSKKVASPSQSVFTGGDGVDGSVYAVAPLPDGSVVIGGRFTSVNGQPRANLARIAPDGTLDTKFLATANDGVAGAVFALALDPSGNLLVGGYFTSAQGQPLQNFVRYLGSGKLDLNFNGGQSPNGPVYAIAVQSDGKIVIGGQFSQIGGEMRRNLARFNADSTLDAPVTSANAGGGSVRSLAAMSNGAIIAGGTFEIPGQTAKNILSVGAN